MAASDFLQNIKDYLKTELNRTDIYLFQRPMSAESITIKPISSGPANVEMWEQDKYFSIEVTNKTSPQSCFNLVNDIRDLLLAKRGLFVTGGVTFLRVFAENTNPEVVDITQEENEVYGMTFRAKLIDETIPL